MAQNISFGFEAGSRKCSCDVLMTFFLGFEGAWTDGEAPVDLDPDDNPCVGVHCGSVSLRGSK